LTLSSGEVTHLLRAMEGDHREVASRLIPLGCAKLRRLMAHSIRQERPLAAQLTRRIPIDHARAHLRIRRPVARAQLHVEMSRKALV
jgi:hypothetical protein